MTIDAAAQIRHATALLQECRRRELTLYIDADRVQVARRGNIEDKRCLSKPMQRRFLCDPQWDPFCRVTRRT